MIEISLLGRLYKVGKCFECYRGEEWIYLRPSKELMPSWANGGKLSFTGALSIDILNILQDKMPISLWLVFIELEGIAPHDINIEDFSHFIKTCQVFRPVSRQRETFLLTEDEKTRSDFNEIFRKAKGSRVFSVPLLKRGENDLFRIREEARPRYYNLDYEKDDDVSLSFLEEEQLSDQNGVRKEQIIIFERLFS